MNFNLVVILSSAKAEIIAAAKITMKMNLEGTLKKLKIGNCKIKKNGPNFPKASKNPNKPTKSQNLKIVNLPSKSFYVREFKKRRITTLV